MINDIIEALELNEFKNDYNKLENSIYSMIYKYYRLEQSYSTVEADIKKKVNGE